MATDHFMEHLIKNNQVDWNFNVIFDGQPAVTAMAKQYGLLLQHPGLYKPVPPQWLHATILRAGLIEDFSEEEMLKVADALRPLLAKLELPEFVFDSWWLWSGNVVLHISPADQFTRIYDAVITAMEQVVGSDRTLKSPHGKFVPHTGLAYTRTHNKELEVNAQLAGHAIKPATFRVGYLPLIKQWAHDGHYEWEIVEKIPVGKT